MWNYIKVKQLTRTSPNYTIYKELIKNVLNLWEIARLSKSRVQNFSRAPSPGGRFFTFTTAKANESALGPTTGTGNEKQGILSKSGPITYENFIPPAPIQPLLDQVSSSILGRFLQDIFSE